MGGVGERIRHRKRLKVCIEKRESYCCYGSQLARIIQEIAHQQLGIPWGSPESPNCGSLTASDLSRLNFDTPYAQSKLSELFAEVQSSAVAQTGRVQEKMTLTKEIQEKVGQLSEALNKRFKEAEVEGVPKSLGAAP